MANDANGTNASPAAHPTWTSLLLFGIGASLAGIAALVRDALGGDRVEPPGEIAVWVADRGGDRVFGLDSDCLVACAIDVRAPLCVASAGAQSVWVLRAQAPKAAADRNLALFSTAGALVFEVDVGRCDDLDVTSEHAAVCLEHGRDGVDRVWRVGVQGACEQIFEGAGLCAVAALSTTIAIGTVRGELVRLEASPPASERSRDMLGTAIVDVAPGPDPDSAWVLDGAHVMLVGARAEVRWFVDAPTGARRLAPIPGIERVWVVGSGPSPAHRFGPGGALEIECSDLAVSRVECALGLADGGVLLALPGALVQRDARGRNAPGQGGFHTLVDVAAR